MANYGRMDIMSMSDEEIERILNEEEKTLEDYEISLLFEELRNRRERAFSPEELPDEEDLIALEESEEEGEDEEGAEGDEEVEEDEEDEALDGNEEDEAFDGNEEEKEEENGRGSSLKQSQSPDSEKKSSFWPAVLIGGLCVLAIIVLFWFLT